MTFNAIFSMVQSGLTAETARLSATASNMSNSSTIASSPDDVYKAQYPIFKAIQENANQWMGQQKVGVEIAGTYESKADPISRYEPNNPMADKKGFVYQPNINYSEEMANMISASRSYQMNVELMDATKKLMQRTLQMGQ